MGKKHHIAYLSLGANLGDRESNIRNGLTLLEKAAVIRCISPFYETQPVDYTDQGWFINIAVKIETRLDAFELLKEIKAIECKAGRKKAGIRFGPRMLDMDILLFDDAVMSTPELTVPHPRMHERCFVLAPLCDINPDIIHPVLGKNIHTLLKDLNDPDQKVRKYL